MILETYTTMKTGELSLPDFLKIEQEVTGNPQYSMYTLSVNDAAVTQLSNGDALPLMPSKTVKDVCNGGGDHFPKEVA
jgi:hypothetical protein